MSNTSGQPMHGCKGLRDVALNSYSPFLYAGADAGQIRGWSDQAKALMTVGSWGARPLTAGGLAVA